MKGLFAFLFAFAFIAAQAKDTLDVTKDLQLINPGLKNLYCDSVHGDYQPLKDLFTYKFGNQPNKLYILYFPSKFRIDTQVVVPSNVHIVLGPSAYCVSTPLLGFSSPIKTIGSSNVHLINYRWTNYQQFYAYAALEFTAAPNKCKNIVVQGANIGMGTNIWASAGILFGFIGDSDSTFWHDGVKLIDDTVMNNRNPSKPYMLSLADYHTNADCSGIDVGNDYKQMLILRPYIVGVGGRNICGLGLSKAFSHDKEAGNITVEDGYLRDGYCGIEISGDYPLNNPKYINNKMFYPTGVGGTGFSVQGRGMQFINNTSISADNGNLELAFYGGICTGNLTYNTGWKDSTQGYHHAPYGNGSRVPSLMLYGFDADVYGNQFIQEPVNINASSPGEWNGITINGKASNGDSVYDRLTYSTHTQFGGGHHIHHNFCTGNTHRVLDESSTSYVEDIVFENNTITSKYYSGNDNPFWIKSFRQKILNNSIDFTGSASPVNGLGLVRKEPLSKGEIVSGNRFKGAALWLSNTPNYKFIQQ